MTLTNMHLFDATGRLRRFDVDGSFAEHARARVALYEKRRGHLIAQARHDLLVAANKARFVEAVLAREIELHLGSHAQLEVRLAADGYNRLPEGYGYLTQMNITALTTDRAAALRAALARGEAGLAAAIESEPLRVWEAELRDTAAACAEYTARKEALAADVGAPPSAPPARRPAKRARRAPAA